MVEDFNDKLKSAGFTKMPEKSTDEPSVSSRIGTNGILRFKGKCVKKLLLKYILLLRTPTQVLSTENVKKLCFFELEIVK